MEPAINCVQVIRHSFTLSSRELIRGIKSATNRGAKLKSYLKERRVHSALHAARDKLCIAGDNEQAITTRIIENVWSLQGGTNVRLPIDAAVAASWWLGHRHLCCDTLLCTGFQQRLVTTTIGIWSSLLAICIGGPYPSTKRH